MLEVLDQDFLRTARAKGIGEWSLVLRHALRDGAIPIVAAIGLELGNLLGGAVITEADFADTGVERLAVEAVVNKDVPLIQAVVFTVAAVLLLVNILITSPTRATVNTMPWIRHVLVDHGLHGEASDSGIREDRLAVEAVVNKDVPLIQAVVFTVAPCRRSRSGCSRAAAPPLP